MTTNFSLILFLLSTNIYLGRCIDLIIINKENKRKFNNLEFKIENLCQVLGWKNVLVEKVFVAEVEWWNYFFSVFVD